MASVGALKTRFGSFKQSSRESSSVDQNTSAFGRSLKHGLICGAILCGLLLGWMALRSGETALRLQSAIPVKTAMIEVPERDVTKDPDAPMQDLNGSKNINALPPAPLEGLSESKDGRTLPIIRVADDLTPFQAYKRPFQPVAGRSLVSFVIVDYGLSEKRSQSMLDTLPPNVTLVLTPYATEPVKWAAAARTFGHEFWMYLPMQSQTFGQDDSGPNTLVLNASLEDNQNRLLSIMGLAQGYAGMISGKDHVFTTEDIDAAPTMKQIFGRGLAFAESNPGIKAYGLSMAMESGYPYVQNTLWLDDDLRPDAVDRALQAMELQATQKGKAIVFLHPYPALLDKVKTWAEGAEARGIQIAPLSAMVQ